MRVGVWFGEGRATLPLHHTQTNCTLQAPTQEEYSMSIMKRGCLSVNNALGEHRRGERKMLL